MNDPRAGATTVRGTHAIRVEMPWRLDGGTEDPEAPLVLALHGMGMDEDLFALLVQKLFALPMRFLVPRAPFPVEVRREGRVGASWYAYDGNQERFRAELDRTERLLLGLLRDVEAGLGLRPRARVLYGFSQGGYCGSYAALRNPDVFGGMVVAGARVKAELLSSEMESAAAHGFRVLLCHGQRDRAVSPEAAERSRAALDAAGVDVTLESLDAGHSVSRGQIEVVARWLTERFGGGTGARSGER